MKRKQCSKCGKRRPVDQFRRTKRTEPNRVAEYVHSWCLGCERASRAARRKADPAKNRRHKIRYRWMRGDRARGRGLPGWYLALERLGRGYGLAIEAKRTPDPIPRTDWIGRMRAERPDLYDPRLTVRALRFRARYHLDTGFRDYHIQKARAREYDRDCASDGTLTVSALRALFAEATDCPYCGEIMSSKDKSLDHVMPLSKGGKHSIANAVVCCLKCNREKSAKVLPVNAILARAG